MIFRVHYEIHAPDGALYAKGSSDRDCDSPAEASAQVRADGLRLASLAPEGSLLRVIKIKRVKE